MSVKVKDINKMVNKKYKKNSDHAELLKGRNLRNQVPIIKEKNIFLNSVSKVIN